MAWEGYVAVKVVPPRTAETVQDNPLGVTVASVNWTQVGATELATPGPSDTTLTAGVKP